MSKAAGPPPRSAFTGRCFAEVLETPDGPELDGLMAFASRRLREELDGAPEAGMDASSLLS